MPTISSFLGIVIRMYYDDHSPAHFHVYYGEHSATIGIDTLELLNGSLPNRVFSITIEWAVLHRKKLSENWQRLEKHQQLLEIEPLE